MTPSHKCFMMPAMNLTDWQNRQGITDTALAEIVGVHPSLFSHIRAGKKYPSRKTALRIQEATGGAVTVMELLFPEKHEGEDAETR